MAAEPRNNLSHELTELFDIKKAKIRDGKKLAQDALEALKDVRLLTLMFRDGIPSITIKATDAENIIWDSKTQKLIYENAHGTQLMESLHPEVMVRMRPHLTELVKKAKDFYQD